MNNNHVTKWWFFFVVALWITKIKQPQKLGTDVSNLQIVCPSESHVKSKSKSKCGVWAVVQLFQKISSKVNFFKQIVGIMAPRAMTSPLVSLIIEK